MHLRSDGRESGFTLIEVSVVVALAGVASAMAVSAGHGWSQSMEHRGTRDSVVSDLRRANTQALAEARRFCVRFADDGRSWTTYRGDCGGVDVVRTSETNGRSTSFSAASFRQADGSMTKDVVFTARGSATPGSLTILRTGSAKEYVVTVEGLTARVSATR